MIDEKTIPKILHQARLVQVNIIGWIVDPTVPEGRRSFLEQILCYDTTYQEVHKAVMDTLLSKGFVSADELRPDWKDKIST